MLLGTEISKRCAQYLCLIQRVELYLRDRTPFVTREIAAWQFDHGIVGAWFDGSSWGLSLYTFLLNCSFRLTAMQLPYECTVTGLNLQHFEIVRDSEWRV